jgi:hypothetical protein
MYVHPDFHSAVTALRRAELRRKVRGEHGVRQDWHERATAARPRSPRGLAWRLASALIHVFVPAGPDRGPIK